MHICFIDFFFPFFWYQNFDKLYIGKTKISQNFPKFSQILCQNFFLLGIKTMHRCKMNIIHIVVPKVPKLDNVLVNVIAAITTQNQLSNQQVLRKCELVKAKVVTN